MRQYSPKRSTSRELASFMDSGRVLTANSSPHFVPLRWVMVHGAAAYDALSQVAVGLRSRSSSGVDGINSRTLREGIDPVANYPNVAILFGGGFLSMISAGRRGSVIAATLRMLGAYPANRYECLVSPSIPTGRSFQNEEWSC